MLRQQKDVFKTVKTSQDEAKETLVRLHTLREQYANDVAELDSRIAREGKRGRDVEYLERKRNKMKHSLRVLDKREIPQAEKRSQGKEVGRRAIGKVGGQYYSGRQRGRGDGRGDGTDGGRMLEATNERRSCISRC